MCCVFWKFMVCTAHWLQCTTQHFPKHKFPICTTRNIHCKGTYQLIGVSSGCWLCFCHLLLRVRWPAFAFECAHFRDGKFMVCVGHRLQYRTISSFTNHKFPITENRRIWTRIWWNPLCLHNYVINVYPQKMCVLPCYRHSLGHQITEHVRNWVGCVILWVNLMVFARACSCGSWLCFATHYILCLHKCIPTEDVCTTMLGTL